MKKECRVCKNYEFSSIIQKRKYFKTSAFVFYYQPKKEEKARIGISVGKKLGNAVARNKVKRQVRSMIDQLYTFDEWYDTILIVRPVYQKQTYQQNMKEIESRKTKLDRQGKEQK
ncbi:ribonuclease P protein component [Firmicutes bacterium M10-2]|nr:ribonuclease P protein component [Firmicutes bacterium M10-2]